MKKQIFIYLIVTVVLSTFMSCKKETDPQGNAGLTIVNALPETNQLIVHFKNESSFDKEMIGMFVKYGVYSPDNHLTVPNQETPLAFYAYQNGTVAQKPIYQTMINPPAGDATTLFLFGTLSQPETLLVTKMPPYYHAADSVMGLRFVNVSTDKKPLKIRIVGEGTDRTLSSIAYKTATDYLTVKANTAVTDVNIECYDAASGLLLKSYTLTEVGAKQPQIPNKWRYHNYTFVLSKDIQGNFPNDPFLVYDF